MCNYCQKYGHSIAECKQKQQVIQNKTQKYKKPNKSAYQYMKKIKTYQIKISTKTLALENHFQIDQIIQEINHLIFLVTEIDHQSKEVHEILHKTVIVDHTVELLNIKRFIHDQIQIERTIFLIPVPIHTLELDTIQMTDHEIHCTIDIEIILTKETAIQIIEIKDIIINQEIVQKIDQINKDLFITTIRIYLSKYNNRQRNYSQSPRRNNTRYPDSQNKYRSNTPKHQRQINQVQTTEDTNSDPPGIDNTETTEFQLNHINCESTDSESETENTILVNMIKIENDYETITYE